MCSEVVRTRTRVSGARLRWLQEQAAAWRDEGLLDDTARERILARYDAEAGERRGMLAIIIIAVLMCGVGTALLIGYNWYRIAGPAKITLLMTLVAAAFAVSSVAYGRGRETAGELLAFAGTLLFGASIWLIAQTLQISGRFPDAFLWFAIGALACAYLVKSSLMSLEGALLAAAWVIAEGTFVPRLNVLYLPIAAVVLLNAYRTREALVVPVAAATTGIWAFLSVIEDSPAIGVGAAALFGCAFHAAGRLHRGAEFGRWWRRSGLGVLLLAFIPLLIEGFHRDAVEGRSPGLPTLIFGAIVALATLGLVLRKRLVTRVDRLLAGVAVAVILWTSVHLFVFRDNLAVAPRLATILYSVLALGFGVSLIRSAVRTNRPADLGFGVLFALVFLIVRWASAADNLLWSGVCLLAAGGGLLLVARLWQRRDRTAGEMS